MRTEYSFRGYPVRKVEISSRSEGERGKKKRTLFREGGGPNSEESFLLGRSGAQYAWVGKVPWGKKKKKQTHRDCGRSTRSENNHFA